MDGFFPPKETFLFFPDCFGRKISSSWPKYSPSNWEKCVIVSRGNKSIASRDFYRSFFITHFYNCPHDEPFLLPLFLIYFETTGNKTCHCPAPYISAIISQSHCFYREGSTPCFSYPSYNTCHAQQVLTVSVVFSKWFSLCLCLVSRGSGLRHPPPPPPHPVFRVLLACNLD